MEEASKVTNSVSYPASIFFNSLHSIYVYGSSNTIWGMCKATTDKTKVIFNRTSATTNCVKLFGVK